MEWLKRVRKLLIKEKKREKINDYFKNLFNSVLLHHKQISSKKLENKDEIIQKISSFFCTICAKHSIQEITPEISQKEKLIAITVQIIHSTNQLEENQNQDDFSNLANNLKFCNKYLSEFIEEKNNSLLTEENSNLFQKLAYCICCLRSEFSKLPNSLYSKQKRFSEKLVTFFMYNFKLILLLSKKLKVNIFFSFELFFSKLKIK